MNLRLLGIIGMLGAPGLAMVLLAGADESWTLGLRLLLAAFGSAYVLGWMASIAGLLRLQATGPVRIGRLWMQSQFVTLPFAIISNFYAALAPNARTPLYILSDLAWPISNFVLLMIGIGVVVAKQITGWKRFVPLACGLWFPLAMTWRAVLPTNVAMGLTMLHSVVAWWLLGYVVFSTDEPEIQAEPDLLDMLA